MRALCGVVVVFALALAARPALADQSLVEAPKAGPRLSLSKRLKSNISTLSTDLAQQLGQLALGLVEMRFDLVAKRAKVGLGGGDPDTFRLRIDSDVIVRGKAARVQARVDLAVAGARLAFSVPEFDMSSSSVDGKQAIQLSVPLLETRF